MGKDPRAIKAALQDAWALSDSKPALIHALQERGFKLARGDRGRFVVIDHNLEIYSLPRWSGQKTKAVRERIGEIDDLPSVANTKDKIRAEGLSLIGRLQSNVDIRSKTAQDRFEARRKALVKKQAAERQALKRAQKYKWSEANKERQARFRSGLKAVWDVLRGEHSRIQKQNQSEAYAQSKQDQKARDDMVWRHLRERQRIEIFKLRIAERVQDIRRDLHRDMQHNAPAPEP